LWITIYFIISYMKLYMYKFSSSIKINIILLCIGIASHLGIILMTNFLGLRFSILANKLLHWNNMSNPFMIIMIIALFNLARNLDFKSKIINYISGLSLTVYIIHENLILRTYYRPLAIDYIYHNYGYSHIVLSMILLSFFILVTSILLSIIYNLILSKLIKKLSLKLIDFFIVIWTKIEKILLKVN
jgi:hypothetical protein